MTQRKLRPGMDALQGGADKYQPRNLRTALILVSIAVAFFLGFLLRRFYQ